MAEPILGSITMFAGSFVPNNYGDCAGSIIPVSENDALFSLLGNTYGGDGRTSFGLPDLRGRLPVGWGTGPGLNPVAIGTQWGTQTVTLTLNQIPPHTHTVMGTANQGDSDDPANRVFATPEANMEYEVGEKKYDAEMEAITIGKAGGDQPHSNIMPVMAIRFIIALRGSYPQRS